jgi:hypothetical protein
LLGIAQGAGTNGNSISGGVLLLGKDSNQAGFTKGDPIFVSDTAGTLASSAGTVSCQVGYAHSATEIFFSGNYFKSILTQERKTLVDAITADASELNQLDGATITASQLTEAGTFFGSTDITGAEAEELTDGSATSLHYHARANGTFTKDAEDSSTTQNIAHGLGALPKKVKILAIINHGTGNYPLQSHTVYNGSTQSSLSHHAVSGAYTIANTFTLNNHNSDSTQTGVITVDATNIIITWTKTGTPSGSYEALWEAEI